jgi:hypothetical protein
MEMPKHQRPWQGREIAKELKPEGRKGQNHGASADIKKHRIVGFGIFGLLPWRTSREPTLTGVPSALSMPAGSIRLEKTQTRRH